MAIATPPRDEEPDRTAIPYQNLLRSIGAHLDEQGATQIGVLETEDGVLVRYQPRDYPAQVVSRRFGVDDAMLWDRRRRHHRLETSSTPAAGGCYQDILRALGHELEHADARQMSLEELGGTYTLTYYAPNREGEPAIRKHQNTIGPAETQQILRRARARRRLPPGWLLESSAAAADPVRLMRVMAAEPVFLSQPGVLLEYTIPALTARNTAALAQRENAHMSGIYRAHRGMGPSQTPQASLLEVFEAATLVTTVYVRCLDPIRFPDAGRAAMGKEEILASVARSLSARKLLAAIELTARHVEDLRSLDDVQPGVGTGAVRWMQYLAAELVSNGPPGLRHEQPRLFAALSAIRASETAADRFAALRHRA